MKSKSPRYEVIKVKGFKNGFLNRNIFIKDTYRGDDYLLKTMISMKHPHLQQMFAAVDRFIDREYGRRAKMPVIRSLKKFIFENYPTTHKKMDEIKDNLYKKDKPDSFEDLFICYSSIKNYNNILLNGASMVYYKNINKINDFEYIHGKNMLSKSEMEDFVSVEINKILNKLKIKKTPSPLEKTAQAFIIFSYLSKRLKYSTLQSYARGFDNSSVVMKPQAEITIHKSNSEQIKKSFMSYSKYLLDNNSGIKEERMNNEYKKNYINELMSFDAITKKQLSQVSKKNLSANIKVLYNTLKTGSGVCYDFSILYEEIMDRLDIKCLTGFTQKNDATGYHATNLVKISLPNKVGGYKERFYGLCITTGASSYSYNKKSEYDMIDIMLKNINPSNVKEKKVAGFGIGKNGFNSYDSHTGKGYLVGENDVTNNRYNSNSTYELLMDNNDLDTKDINFIKNYSLNYYKKNIEKEKKKIELHNLIKKIDEVGRLKELASTKDNEVTERKKYPLVKIEQEI